MAKTKQPQKANDSWKTQARGQGGKFLPKDAHIEDVQIGEFTFGSDTYPMTSYISGDTFDLDDLKPTTRLSKRRKQVILGYVGYVVLCFLAGAVGAYIGALHLVKLP